MVRGLKKFILSVVILLAIVVCLDWGFGKAMDYMMPRIGIMGEFGKIHHAIKSIKSPFLVIGSSRAVHHYNPSMLSDSLNCDVYNLGVDGRFFSHNCGVINSILDRYSPNIIVWEFRPLYLYEGKENLTDLYKYYGKESYITDMINEQEDWSEKIRLKSNQYKYNSTFHIIFKRFLLNASDKDKMLGYIPIDSTNKMLKIGNREHKEMSINESNVRRFIATIERLKNKGCKVILVDSPVCYIDKNKYQVDYFKALCDSLNVTFIDNSQLKEFLEHPDYFKDMTHLNSVGADVYTKYFIEQLRGLQLFIN